jgi:hypothetical protein
VLLQLFDNPSIVGNRKFNFLVQNTFLTTSLGDLLKSLQISNEQVVEVYYIFALEKPKPVHTAP